jgi:hypothetical protein
MGKRMRAARGLAPSDMSYAVYAPPGAEQRRFGGLQLRPAAG